MQSEPNTAQTPFQINVAERVKRLPPYLFGKINDLKYRKRRAGVDIIEDLPWPELVKLEKLARETWDDNWQAIQRRASPTAST